MTKRTKTTETAAQAYYRNHAEAKRRLALLVEALDTKNKDVKIKDLHWGHVGDVGEVNELLARACHYAGVAEFVEK